VYVYVYAYASCACVCVCVCVCACVCVCVAYRIIPLAKMNFKKLHFWIFLAMSFFMASYVRPELALPFLVSFLILLGFTFLELRKNPLSVCRESYFPFLLLTTLLIFLPLSFNGFPAGWGNVNQKSFQTFKMKNLLRLSLNDQIKPKNIDQDFQKIYGGANSIWGALQKNPGEFAGHLNYNLKNTASLLGNQLKSILFVKWGPPFFVLFFLFFLVILQSFSNHPRFFKKQNIHPAFWFLGGGIALAEISACLFYGPYFHYILPLVPFLLAFLAAQLLRSEMPRASLGLLTMLCLGLVFLPPNFESKNFRKEVPNLEGSSLFENKNTLEFIRDLKTQPGWLLTSGGFHWSFFPEKFSDGGFDINFLFGEYFVGSFLTDTFPEMLKKKNWALILVNSSFLKNIQQGASQKYQKSFRDFQKRPEAFGYNSLPVPNSSSVVYLKNSI